MPRVFISHSCADNDISRKIAHNLKRDGIEIWIDYTRIHGGDSLPKRISEALEWCDTLILLWSKSAQESYYVNLEWENALDLRKVIIPCTLDETKRPAILRRCLFIDFKDFDTGYNELCRALKLQTPEEKKKAEKKPIERTKKPKEKLITKKTVLTILVVICIVLGIYFINPLIQRKNKKAENASDKVSTQITLSNIHVLRSESISLSFADVKSMVKNKDFFDSDLNDASQGFDNQFDCQIINGERIVIDRAASLMWQQSGSPDEMSFGEAKQWIRDLNKKGYAGYHDWHLPTLEEAMSLMEPMQKNNDLYIDSVFDKKQRCIWTSDLVVGESWAWIVCFAYGLCNRTQLYHGPNYVRAVRFEQSSGKTTEKTSQSVKNLSHDMMKKKQIFRSDFTFLSDADVIVMLKENNFFESRRNKTGKGFSNRFRTNIIDGKTVVIDTDTGLMWQQGGSSNDMLYYKAKEYIQELNRTKFTGFTDWRLPTLEEAMSLMEPKIMNGDLYIDPKFDAKQPCIWTSDQVFGESRAAWVVHFYDGCCGWRFVYDNNYVRAVRSRQSSQE